MRVFPGRPYPLGATFDGLGVNFAIFSSNAHRVELCLFDKETSTRESRRIELPEYTDQVWHGYLPDVGPGQLYGYRVYGPYEPERGLRFNPNKLLVDPYAKAIARPLKSHDAMFGYRAGARREDIMMDTRNNAAYAPLCAVIDQAFTWGDDRAPKTPWHKTVIYEAHVKGMTMLHPEVPEDLRGTYAGLATRPILRHLKSLGVTAIELLPIHHRVNEQFLEDKGLTNYWGYNTLAYFAPDLRFASSPGWAAAIREFKMMVRAFHAEGIEVILDVVYNHTAEGNHLGPTLSFRGIDNPAYYRLSDTEPRYYKDFTGCGNTLNMQHPRVLQLIMDSLRYWIQEMRVDGFRFDLASALARELHEVDKLGAFFDIIHQDPVISQAKLIAEPWDLGVGGYQVGNFPVLWTEWNGQYRDSMRSFWKGDGGRVSDLATRFAGSSDLYQEDGRLPHASINFITCHDGFSLADLVSYNMKRNDANQEDNRDGENHNMSWNCGVEGPTDDPEILALRARQMRNLMGVLLLSMGVPMISGGDELGRSQGGNNNAYCQDNEISWTNWTLSPEEASFLEFTKRMVRLRLNQPALHRRKFLLGRECQRNGYRDIYWFAASGHLMNDRQWFDPYNHFLGALLDGDAIHEMDEAGCPIQGDTLLILMNGGPQAISFPLPHHRDGVQWRLIENTGDPPPEAVPQLPAGEVFVVGGRSLCIFQMCAVAD